MMADVEKSLTPRAILLHLLLEAKPVSVRGRTRTHTRARADRQAVRKGY